VKIASWNVNSIKARLPQALDWINTVSPDVLCMQEIKVVDADFPRQDFERLGYQVAVSGQKGYNGVAIASRVPLADIGTAFVEDEEEPQRRLIEARCGDTRLINVYVPNGQAVGSPKFAYKLQWLARLRKYLATRYSPQEPLILCGDFNVAPEERDVYDARAFDGQVLFHPEERAALQKMSQWGLLDSFRLHTQEGGHYSWWDYRLLAFRRNLGLRIDHIWLTRPLVARCAASWIDPSPRKLQKPSDHAPVGIDLS